jgi:hypothetical protein
MTNFGGPPDGYGYGQRPGDPPPEPPYLIPAGMPPGVAYMHEERPPEGVYYFRIYGGLMTLTSAASAIFGLVMVTLPIFDPARGHGAATESWVIGVAYGVFGAAFFVPWLLALFGGRKPWVHTLGLVLIALGMTQLCCLPIQIPLLLTWLKPETKRWYGAR